MPDIIRSNLISLGVVIFALFNGAMASAQEKTVTPADLEIIVLAYQLHQEANGKGPAVAEDLAPFFEKDKRLLEALKSGRIQFQYNVGIRDIVKTTGTAKTILVYEKDLPSKGGYAAFADGNVKKMTPEEFKKATLAGVK